MTKAEEPERLRQILRQRALLNVAELVLYSHSNGPGLRSVIWLQGCSIRCPGCINKDFIPFVQRKIVRPAELAKLVWLEALDVEGITVTGGEPFDQAEGLAVLLSEIQERGLSTVVYTGYYIEDLRSRSDPTVDQALGHADILVDGPYLAWEDKNVRGRGSANQRVHFLTNRYDASALEDALVWPHEEMVLRGDNEVIRTGILKHQFGLEPD
jgi:anaerobic ribonucleoside-triphosphate reductase activating protein